MKHIKQLQAFILANWLIRRSINVFEACRKYGCQNFVNYNGHVEEMAMYENFLSLHEMSSGENLYPTTPYSFTFSKCKLHCTTFEVDHLGRL